MKYRKINYSFSEFLSKNIFAIYELATGDEDCYYQTIPNGLIGLTFLTEGGAWFSENKIWKSVPEFSIYGLIKKPGLIKTNKNSRDISVGFNPFFLSLFLSLPMQQVAGQFIDAKNVFFACDLEEARDKINKAENDMDLVLAIESFLLKYFKQKPDMQLAKAYEGISKIQYTRVDELSKDLNISSRTLLNKFRDKVGLSPKELMKIHRINSSLNIKMHKHNNLTALAYKLGYFDQAHFIHDFKETLGITPEMYFKNKGMVSDFYNYDRWSLV